MQPDFILNCMPAVLHQKIADLQAHTALHRNALCTNRSTVFGFEEMAFVKITILKMLMSSQVQQYIRVCVCACARVRACLRVCACVCVGGGIWKCGKRSTGVGEKTPLHKLSVFAIDMNLCFSSSSDAGFLFIHTFRAICLLLIPDQRASYFLLLCSTRGKGEKSYL